MAGDPFLSDPSRKKRGRVNRSTSAVKRTKTGAQRASKRAPDGDENDEIISGGSDSEDEQGNVSLDSETNDSDEIAMSSDEEFADENAADKRRRLAKQYLDNLKQQELGDDQVSGGIENYDFDAQDLDDDILARRLQTDVAEQKGYVYKFIGDEISKSLSNNSSSSNKTVTRIGSQCVTSMAVRWPYIYTVSKDCELIKWKQEISRDGNLKISRVKHVKKGPKNHRGAILSIATSPDGRFVVTGGIDGKILFWLSENLVCLKELEVCRKGGINLLSFRRGTDLLFAACGDLRIRTFSVNQFAQLETLFGHQDTIADVLSLAKETCVSVGSRDKTAMFWKVAEESRLTFRGGSTKDQYSEGTIDVVSMVDESHFVTGSDNGNVALWSLAKKKPLYIQRLAHGLREQLKLEQASAEVDSSKVEAPKPQPYEITSIHAIPYSDIFITGSYNGSIRVWKIGQDGLRSFEQIAEIGGIKGCIVKIADCELDGDKNKLAIHVLVSKENKFGRWHKVAGARNALVSLTVNIA